MNSFLDTSSLVKLYDPSEAGAAALQQQLTGPGIIYLSTLTEVEFASALAGKQRAQPPALTATSAQAIYQRFVSNKSDYGWIEQTPALRQRAVQLIQKYSYSYLRALDAIQLASALAVRADIQAFFTHDQRLREAASAEGLPVVR